MRRCGWLLLLPILLSGCVLTEQSEHQAFLKRFQEKAISPDHALIEMALLERHVGDEYINKLIWQHTDELFVNLEGRVNLDRHGELNENGIRAGQLVGTLPADFQSLLLSKRYCSNPQAMIFPAGKTVPIHLSAVLPQSSYEFVQGKLRTPVNLDQARYSLSVKARFASDGRTTLTFTPKVEHGAPTLPFEAIPERSAWQMKIERASKQYPELSWEVTLGPNQYFIVGARLERERTFGQTAFTEFIGDSSVQRLLVIRNCRSVSAQEAHQNSVEELVRADRNPPLALQATLPVSRAKAN